MSEHEVEIAEAWRRAKDSLEAAQELLGLRRYDIAASRAYYAAFYAATALLLSAGKEFLRHSGVITHMHKDYIRTGLLPQEMGRILNWLFSLRNVGDYGGPAHVDPEQAEVAVMSTRRFVEAIDTLLPKPPQQAP
jgi:uncharacterized protein (UPF0332 family)